MAVADSTGATKKLGPNIHWLSSSGVAAAQAGSSGKARTIARTMGRPVLAVARFVRSVYSRMSARSCMAAAMAS